MKKEDNRCSCPEHDLGFKVQLETALQKSGEKYCALVESINEVIFMLDKRGCFSYVSPLTERISKYKIKEIIGKPFTCFIHPKDRQRLQAKIRELTSKRSNKWKYKDEFRVVHKDGTIGHVRVFIQPIPKHDESNKLIGVLCDITEQKKIEDALRKSEERYRSLFENSPISLWEEDFSKVKKYIENLRKSGVKDLAVYFKVHPEEVIKCMKMVKVVDVNKATLSLYKARSKKQLINDGLNRILPSECYQKFVKELITIAKGKTRFTCEAVNQTLTGEKRQVAIAWSVAPGYEKSLAKVIVSKIDITQQKKIEEELRENERRYRNLFENVPIVIFTISADGIITSLNPAFERITGWSCSEFIGKPFMPLVHPDDLPIAISEFRRLLNGKTPPPFELRIKSKSGEYLIGEFRGSPLFENGKIVGKFGIAQDITERKKAEEILCETVNRALRQQAAVVALAKEEFSDFEFAAKKITEIDSKTINVERVSIWIFNEDHSAIVCSDLYERSKNRHEKGAVLLVKNYPRYFKALEESRVIAANDAQSDPRTNEFLEDYLSVFGITSMMDVPIRLRGKTIGVVCHEHVGPKREWTFDEQNFAGSIADMISLALQDFERKKIEEELRESEERFRSVVENSHDGILIVGDDYKFAYVNEELCRILGYPKEEVIGQDFRKFLDEESKKLVAERYIRRQRGENIPSRYEFKVVRKNGEKRDVKISSAIIKDRHGKVWTISQILDITERKRFEERFSALNTYGQSLNKAKSMNEIYRLTLEAMEKILGFEFADIFILEGKMLCLTAHRGYSKILSLKLPIDGKRGVTVKAVKTGKPILIPDVRKEKAYVKAGEGTLSELAVPIKTGKRILGVLNVESRKLAAFDENDVKLLETLASHAAVALSNLKRQEVLSALNKYGRRVNMAANLKEIYELTLDAMEKTLGFEYASLLMIEGKTLRLVGCRKYPKELDIVLPFDGNKGVTVKAAKAGKAIFISDLRKEEAYVPGRPGMLSELAVPMKMGTRVLGVLNVESERLAAFNEDDKELLEILASHAAIAISNLKRREKLKTISNKITNLMENSTKIMQVKDMHQRLEVIAKTIQNFGWRRVVISLKDENLEGTDLVAAGLTKEEMELLLKRKAPGHVWKERLGAKFEKYKIGEFYYLPWSDQWIRENVHGLPPGAPPDEETTYAGVPSKLPPEEMVDWHPQDMLYAPLRTPEGKIVGILSMDDPVDGRKPTRETLMPLELFIHQAAITIENTQLIEQLKKASSQLAAYAEQLEQMVEERTRQLKKSQEDLLKAQRLAVIGELAGMVGHDLRNPLTSIAGATYYAKKHLTDKIDGKIREMLELIEKNIAYSNKIINDLLDYSREITLDLRETSPKKLVMEVLCSVNVPKKIKLVDLTKDEPKIKVDIDKLKRVLMNIIKNAIDAMPKGGTLTIKSKKQKDSLEIAITDTGVGMSKETLEKLWTPLFTTKAKGMGFGLPICKRFIEAHGGTICAKSTMGKGSTFTVTIPIEPKVTTGGENVWVKMPESSLLTTTKT